MKPSPSQNNYEQLAADYQRVEQAILYLERHYKEQPSLEQVASSVGLSDFHFQRLFTRWAGVSPKRFLQFVTKENARKLLDESQSLLDTALELGLSSTGRLHDLFVTTEAVSPGEYKTRGKGLTIRYGLHPTPFGRCIIGITSRGICHLGFAQSSEGAAIDAMAASWKAAELLEDQHATREFMEPIFDLAQRSRKPLHIHLQGTNFQVKVWQALLEIPPGTVTTYAGIAGRIGHPSSLRAVGSAVGRNPVAVLIPCHRVIRKVGEFGNYRYGTARKQALLAWETAHA
jgi:AraC family transcriptional regulator of adaptative response/methylated-DNA-[protein]-cysteine methyltransferase